MTSTDPSSLQNLNDIVLPAAVDWWPLAIGWYVLIGLVLISIAWFGYQAIQHRFKNRYRREALRQLQLLEKDLQTDAKRNASLRQLPILLKRTALCAYPRTDVASLAGNDWHEFLNSKLKTPVFTASTARHLDNISYSCGDLAETDSEATAELLNASKYWLQHHQPACRSQASEVR